MDLSASEPVKVVCVLKIIFNILKHILNVFITLYAIDNIILVCVFSLPEFVSLVQIHF